MSETGVPRLAVIPVLAGLAWLLGPADESVIGFALSVLPGALLLGGGVAAFILPGDLRAQQVTALGGAAGALLGVVAPVFAGAAFALLLIGLSVASFLAAGWLAVESAPEVEQVPAPRLGGRLAAFAALDEALLGTMSVRNRPPARSERHLSAEEVRRAEALFGERGWLDKPVRYHSSPPPLESPALETKRSRALGYEHMSFASEYEPPEDVAGRERWLAYSRNRTAHAWVLRHSDGPRPWLMCIHGYGMGNPGLDLRAFEPGLLHRELGLNLVLPVLPLHGPRRIARTSGAGFLGGYELDSVHAEAQAMWDLRRILGWVRAQGALAVGVYGLSLGGYTAALLAGLEGDLACAIPGIPATDFARLARRFATPLRLREVEAIGLGWEDVEAVLRVVSPLALEPRVPHERRFIFGGTADRLVPPDQVRDLWLHWDRPRIVWYQGSHLSAGREPTVRAFLREALVETLRI